MEINFKEPNLRLYKLLNSPEDKNKLREYLLNTININIYQQAVNKGILEYNKEDFNLMSRQIEEKLKEFERKKEEDSENEAFILEINKQICELYAQTFDLENFEKLTAELLEKDCTPSLKMDILMCKIRIAIIAEDRKMLRMSVEEAENMFISSCDWDRKNRLKVYLGLFHIMKAEFSEAAEQFSECLASFEATELLSFEELILYLVFSALLSFSRNELKDKIINNSEVRKCQKLLVLPEFMYECQYHKILRELLNFIEIIEKDLFLSHFKEHFCKIMKIKIYSQLLLSYQSLHLEKMAQIFDVSAASIEEDLRNFINEGKLNCVIDRIDKVVKMRDAHEEDHLFEALLLGEKILRNIKKNID